MGDDATGDVNFGYWFVAFIDLLGQQDAFLKTDALPTDTDPAKRQPFVDAVKASLGVVRTMRRLLASFREPFSGAETIKEGSPLHGVVTPEQTPAIETMLKRRVREYRWSDGFILACPLQPSEGHAIPILAAHDVMSTCAAMILIHLAMGRPLRGGIDVGSGTEEEGELFGAAVVKAYQLESKRAKYPRLAVGQSLVNYVTRSAHEPGVSLALQLERATAKSIGDMPAQAMRSNIHAGMMTPASSATTQTKTSSPPRFSRYRTAISLPRDGCHG